MVHRSTIIEILNYRPTKIELAIDTLTRKSEYVSEYGVIGDFIELNVAIEIIKELFDEKKDTEELNK